MTLTTEDLAAIQTIVRGETEPIKADLESFARATNEQFIIIDERFDKIESRLDMVETSLESVASDVGEIKNTLQFHHLEPRSGNQS